MKINNPFKSIRKKITDSREKNELRETERMVNHDVYVGNDPNDIENGIYIFCGGIPVLRVVNDPCMTNNEVGIDEVAEVLKNIKDMYRNSLNGNQSRINRWKRDRLNCRSIPPSGCTSKVESTGILHLPLLRNTN